MKKLSTILLSSLFLSPLAACGDDGDGDDTAGSTGPTGTGTGTTTGTATGTTTAPTSSTSGTTDTTGDDTTTTGDDTETGTDTDTEGDTETGTETGTGTDTEADTETGTETGTGTDTEGSGPDYPVCMYSCEEDDDCLSDGTDQGYTCEDNECVCSPGGACDLSCEEDIECQVRFWAPCSDDCTNTCVVVEDEELCPLLVPIEGVLECDASSEEIELPDADGNPVAVCVSNALLCRDVDGGMMCAGEPTPPCTDEDVECPEGLMCDEDSGNCLACLQDSDCEEGEYCNGSCITPCEDAEEDCTPWLDGLTASCG